LTVDATSASDATTDTSTDSGPAATACIPGRSVACAGPGGCSSNQVCNSDGTGYGPCDCAPSTDAGTTPCVPGQSIACAGPGGCISSQVCNAAGGGYGACSCLGEGGSTLLCVPGQSIACGGPFGCASYQVCNGTGNGYSPCDCPDAFSYLDDAGAIPDGYAPLPPPVGNQPYNAIWSPVDWTIYLPLFSAPDCTVIPPYGDSYWVEFRPEGASGGAGPSGTFPICSFNTPPCYGPQINGANGWDGVDGDMYTLTAFGGDGLATGHMDT
jgi:hypothetical protein